MSSTSSRFESCGEMKSQNSSLQLGAQGDEYSGSLCLDFGFKTQDVMAAAELLDDAERQEVEDLGFSTFLNLQLGTICERKETNLCMKLVDLEENRIRVQLQKDVIGYITPEEISHLLMLPRGDKAPLKYNKQQQKDFAKLRAELGGSKNVVGNCRYIGLDEKRGQKTFEVMYTQDMTSLKDYDFCAIVYEHLRDSIRTWKATTLDKFNKSMTMPGCIIIILGFIVDNLKLTKTVDKKCPRINQYTMATLMGAIGNAKCHHGRISFDNFKLKALEETCYAESSRFYIQSPVDSQDSAVVTSGVPPETQMPMPMQVLQQAHGILSAVSIAGLSVAQSIGIDPEAVNECIAGLTAMQPLDLEKFGVAQSGVVNRGLARSDAGASCSDGVFGNPTTEISGIAEDAEAAKTKKATVHEEETSCSISDGVNGNPTTEISGIAEAARTVKTKKSASRKNVAKVASKNPAGENAGTSRILRSSSRPNVVRHNGKVVENYGALAGGALAGGDDTSPAKPNKKHAKR